LPHDNAHRSLAAPQEAPLAGCGRSRSMRIRSTM
jgi:hypothetical protein